MRDVSAPLQAKAFAPRGAARGKAQSLTGSDGQLQSPDRCGWTKSMWHHGMTPRLKPIAFFVFTGGIYHHSRLSERWCRISSTVGVLVGSLWLDIDTGVILVLFITHMRMDSLHPCDCRLNLSLFLVGGGCFAAQVLYGQLLTRETFYLFYMCTCRR